MVNNLSPKSLSNLLRDQLVLRSWQKLKKAHDKSRWKIIKQYCMLHTDKWSAWVWSGRHLEFTREHWWSLLSLCVCILTCLHMRNCMMSTWTTYCYIHTYIGTAIFLYEWLCHTKSLYFHSMIGASWSEPQTIQKNRPGGSKFCLVRPY